MGPRSAAHDAEVAERLDERAAADRQVAGGPGGGEGGEPVDGVILEDDGIHEQDLAAGGWGIRAAAFAAAVR